MKTPEYIAWLNMHARCGNRNNEKYADYGGRGVRVCRRWKKFSNFLSDMGPRPPDHVLDRRDNDDDYTPGNCRWATKTESTRNRRCTRYYTVGLVSLTLAEWAERLGVSRNALNQRLRLGWPVELALTTPKTYGRLSPEEVRTRRRARVALGNAVRDGKVVKPDKCQRLGCTNRAVQAHHQSHDAPLSVIWLCRTHHKEANLACRCVEVLP